MLQYEQVTSKVWLLPPPLLQEVELFIDYLISRYREQSQINQPLDATTMTNITMAGGAFEWLNDPREEGIYSDEDGEPV